MQKIFDIVQILCDWYGYTMKDFATRASIPYTTFVSMMSRRPDRISVTSLSRIAAAFDHEWYVLLGHNEESVPALLGGRDIHSARVESTIDEETYVKVLEKITGKEYGEVIGKDTVFCPPAHLMKAHLEKSRKNALHLQFKSCIDLVSDKLNDDGIIEAMRYILELTQNPKYNASAGYKVSEDVECQEEGQ